MKQLAVIFSCWMLMLGSAAMAKSLDEARSLAQQIQDKSGQKFSILRADAADDLYTDVSAVGTLNSILRDVLADPNLKEKRAVEVGQIIVERIGFYLNVDSAQARIRFCELASDSSKLFSPDLAEGICYSISGGHSQQLLE